MKDPWDGLKDDMCRAVIGELDGDWHYCRKPRARVDGVMIRDYWCAAHRRLYKVPIGGTKSKRPSRRVADQERYLANIGQGKVLDPALDEAA